MKKHDKGFGDRLERAAAARKLLLNRFAAKPAADDPAVVARAAERQAVKEAREARAAAKQAEREAAEAARAAAAVAAEAAAGEDRVREGERLAEQTAQRDARYAARKARKG